MFEMVAQTMLVLLSGASSWHLSRGKVKQGCIYGLSSEVFWGYTALVHEQWGVFLMVIWFTGCFITGLYKVMK